MKRIQGIVLALAAIAVAVLPGCGKGSGPEALVQQWKSIADAALQDIHKQADVPTAMNITQQLAATGPAGIDPLLDILADPTANPRTKMLVTMCVKPVLRVENLKRVAELTDPKYEVNTRVNAAHIAASINDPALVARAAELLKDPEPRVRLAVFNAQLLHGAPEALAMVDAMWKDPGTDLANKTQIVLGLPEHEAPKYLPIFVEAAGNNSLDPMARGRAITLLGRFGDAAALPVLEKSASSDPDPEVKKGAQIAWEALKSRLGNAPAPATTPPAPEAAPAPPANDPAAAAPAATPAPPAGNMSPADIGNFTGGKAVKQIQVPGPGAPKKPAQ